MNIKRKKDKLSIRPINKKDEIIERRPFDMWTDMDQLFDQFRMNFDNLFWRPTWDLKELQEKTSMPPMDIIDLGDKYEMKLDMPGIPKENISIDVNQCGLEVSAEYQKTDEEKDKNWLRRERQNRKFYRCLELPDEIKTDMVDAELKEGVLTITMPKIDPKPKFKSTKVKIK
jgi:HSP20 family protein